MDKLHCNRMNLKKKKKKIGKTCHRWDMIQLKKEATFRTWTIKLCHLLFFLFFCFSCKKLRMWIEMHSTTTTHNCSIVFMFFFVCLVHSINEIVVTDLDFILFYFRSFHTQTPKNWIFVFYFYLFNVIKCFKFCTIFDFCFKFFFLFVFIKCAKKCVQVRVSVKCDKIDNNKNKNCCKKTKSKWNGDNVLRRSVIDK